MIRIVRITLLSFVVLAFGSQGRSETTLEFWQFWTDPDVKPVIDEIVSEFEAQHPDINVEITDLTWANGHEKIVVAFASETGPDIVELGSDWIAQFAESGHLTDIGSDIKDDSANYQGWSMATYEGKVYGQPWILGTRVLFVNAELNNRIMGDSTLLPVTLKQFGDACKKGMTLGEDVYGWGSNTAEKHRLYKKFLPFFWSHGAQLFTDDGRYCVLASTHAVEALRYYKELHDSCAYVANQRGIEDAFLEGKICYIMSGDWLLRRVQKESSDFEFYTTLVPGQKLPGRSFMGGEFLTINSASDHKDEALEFIQFMASPENQVKLCKAGYMANPSSLKAQEDSFFVSDEHLQTFIKQMRLAKHPPVHPDWVDMEATIEEAIEKALFGEKNLVAHPLYEAEKKIQSIMDR